MSGRSLTATPSLRPCPRSLSSLPATWKRWFGATLLLLLPQGAACQTYPNRTEKAFADFERGHLSAALDAYQDPATTGCEYLHYVESGTVALAAGHFETARQWFQKAAKQTKELEDAALISPESVAEEALGFVINESTQTYQGEGYERVLVHLALAITYLAAGDLEATRVELRLSDQLLTSEETLYAKSYEAGGLGHYLSGIAYEMEGRLDEAWIDYQRMLSKNVGLDLAGKALVRIGARLSRAEEVNELEKRFGEGEQLSPDTANIVVVAGVGIGPYKVEHTLPVPTGDGIFQWSVPSFEARPQVVSALEVEVRGGDRRVRTDVIENVTKVAYENLEDRLAWLAAKSALRAFLKLELQRQLQEEHGDAGLILGILFTALTERADLRAWQTLPDTWQAARIFVPAGKHQVFLHAIGGQSLELGTFELEARETMFVFGRTLGSQVFAYPIGGRRLDTPLEPALEKSTTTPTQEINP